MMLDDPAKALQCESRNPDGSDLHCDSGIHVLPTHGGNADREVVFDVCPLTTNRNFHHVTLHTTPPEAVRLALQLLRQSLRAGHFLGDEFHEQLTEVLATKRPG